MFLVLILSLIININIIGSEKSTISDKKKDSETKDASSKEKELNEAWQTYMSDSGDMVAWLEEVEYIKSKYNSEKKTSTTTTTIPKCGTNLSGQDAKKKSRRAIFREKIKDLPQSLKDKAWGHFKQSNYLMKGDITVEEAERVAQLYINQHNESFEKI